MTLGARRDDDVCHVGGVAVAVVVVCSREVKEAPRAAGFVFGDEDRGAWRRMIERVCKRRLIPGNHCGRLAARDAAECDQPSSQIEDERLVVENGVTDVQMHGGPIVSSAVGGSVLV